MVFCSNLLEWGDANKAQTVLTFGRTMRDDPIVYADGIEGVARIAPYVAGNWLSLLQQGSTVTVTIPGNNTNVELEQFDNQETGGLLANSLTSWGPSWAGLGAGSAVTRQLSCS